MSRMDVAPAAPAAATAPIRVTVNGVLKIVPPMTLAQWVESTGAAPAALATAVNGEFVPRLARARHMLAEGDVIMTFQPIEGG